MDIKNKRILVTGGAGFIGSHIVEDLLGKGAEVIAYDNFSTGTIDNLKSTKDSKELQIIKGDILDFDALRRAMKNVNIVSHHAAELEVFTGIRNMHHDLEINIEGTVNVLRAAMDTGVEKLIYASSGAVYGQAKCLPEDEKHPLDPHWPYGVSKLAGEKYCTMVWNLYKFPTISLRYSIVYGPKEWYGRVLTLFIKRCLEGKPPVIFGDGRQTRDFVYISDVVEAHDAAIQREKANGKTLNIGSGKGVSIQELAESITNLTNPNLKPIYDDPKENEDSKYQPGRKRLVGELKNFVLDIAYAKEILGYCPKVSLKEGIKMEMEWVRDNKDRWNVRPRV